MYRIQLRSLINKGRQKLFASEQLRKIISGASWSLVGNISGRVLMVLAFIIVARIVGKDDYGKLGVIRSTIAMFVVFSSMGMGLTSARYVAYYRNSDVVKALQIHRAAQRVSVFFGLILCAILLLFSHQIAVFSFKDSQLDFPLKLSIITLFCSTIASAQTGTLTGFEDFKASGINNLIYGIIQFIGIVAGAYFFGVNGVIIALGGSAAILVLLNEFSLRSYTSNPVQQTPKIFTSEIWNVIIKFSIPAVLSTIVALPVIWWGKALLVRSSDFSEMAVFDVSEQWNMLVLFVPTAIGAIILPMLSNAVSDGTEKQYGKLLKLNLFANVSIVIVIATVLMVSAPLILNLYGKNFTSYLPLRVLLISSVLQTVNSVLGQAIASKAKMWLGFMVNAIWGTCFLICCHLFIVNFRLGALGLSLSFLVSYFIHSFIQGFIAFKIKL